MSSPDATPNLPTVRNGTVAGETGADECVDVFRRVLEIEAEQIRLKEFLERAEALKDRVREAVYRKVVDDYSERSVSLVRQAEQVKIPLCDVQDTLQTLFTQITDSCERARLELEELEFRHAVGELTPAQLVELRKEPEWVLDQGRTELAAIAQAMARFAGILEPSASTDVDAGMFGESTDRSAEDAPIPIEVSVESADPTPHGGAERPFSVTSIARALERTSVSQGPTQNSEAPTFALPIAALICIGDGDAPSVEYRLGTLNYLGRSEDNLIQIEEPCASRRHAAVVATPAGYVVEDLHSQNGTFVNGEQIKERLLADGDRIQVGDVQIIFRSPWGGRAAR